VNVPKKTSERCLKEQIEYYFDVSSDKKLLQQDIQELVDKALTKIKKFRGCDDPTTYGLLYGDGIADTINYVKEVLVDDSS